MLRGKFGKIGTDFRDGHLVMDAFQQAAFRDQIRSGERINFLASRGLLKHKRTRNPIIAEETPRSSCPSSDAKADPRPAQGAGDRAHWTSTTSKMDKRRTTSPEATPNPDGVMANRTNRSVPEGRQNLRESLACHQSPPPSPRTHSSHDGPNNTDVTEVDTRVSSRDHANRPHSAGSVRPRQSKWPGQQHSQSQPPEKHHQRRVTREEPLQVGPVLAAAGDEIDGGGGEQPKPPMLRRHRPASAGGFRAPNAPHTERETSSGGHSGPVWEKRRRPPCQPIAKERVDADPYRRRGSGKRSVASTPWTPRQRRQNMSRSPGDGNRGCASSPGITQKHAASNVVTGGDESSEDFAEDTRFMPVGAVHKAYRGHRLAAVQAWDPNMAAAVRAARAENVLRGRTADTTNRDPSEYALPVRGGAQSAARSGATSKAVADIASKCGRRGRPSSAPFGRGGGTRGGYGGNRGESDRGDGNGSDGGDTLRLRDRHRELTPTMVKNEPARRGHDASGRGRLHSSKLRHKVPTPETALRGGRRKRRPPSSLGGESEAEPEGKREAKAVLAESFATYGARTGRSYGGAMRSPPTRSTTGPSIYSSTSRSSHANYSGTSSAASRRSAYTSSDSLPTNRACDADVSERRTRLLVELETLRRRVHDAEGRLRSVDCSLPGRRRLHADKPENATSVRERAQRISPTTAATTASSSLRSSARDGVPTAGENVVSPLVVTHSARAFLCEL